LRKTQKVRKREIDSSTFPLIYRVIHGQKSKINLNTFKKEIKIEGEEVKKGKEGKRKRERMREGGGGTLTEGLAVDAAGPRVSRFLNSASPMPRGTARLPSRRFSLMATPAFSIRCLSWEESVKAKVENEKIR